MRTPRSRRQTESTGRLGLATCFLLTGVAVAVWGSRIPDIQQHADAQPAKFGLTLFAGAVGALIAMQLSGRLLPRLPAPIFLRSASVGVAVTLVGPALADSVVQLAVALFLQGLAHGAMAVAMNTCAVGVERELGRPVMSSFHSAFSIGSLAGALAGVGSTHISIDALTLFTTAGSVQLLVLAMIWRNLPSSAATRADDMGTSVARATTPPSQANRTRLMILSLLAVAAMVCEGSISDWCGIYVRDELGGSSKQAPLAFAAYAVSMTIGRLIGDSIAGRWGRLRFLRYSALAAAVGLALTVIASSPGLGLVGFAIFGLGQACVMPQLISLAGQSEGIDTGRVVARVVGLSQVGFLIGPMLVGPVAQNMSLRIAFGITTLLCLVIAATRMPGITRQGPGDRTPKGHVKDLET
ncbi:MFS transporter [Streptomyces sp. CA-135486]|uniref:MFS transporter n=1 Tax=Streptomyces sp. CA-135486 TaxID=3240049 RepID=UPI003D8BCF6F